MQFVGYMNSIRYITIFYQRFEKEIVYVKVFLFLTILFPIRYHTFMKEKTKKNDSEKFQL